MVSLYVNSCIVCGLFCSWQGVPPQSFERSIWDCVGFYTIDTFLNLSVECQEVKSFLQLIISFLEQLQHHFFFSSNSQSQHASSSSIVLYLQLGAERPTTQSYNSWYGLPVLLRVTLASRGNSAFENLQQETHRPKCCLNETSYVAAPVRETGDVIARILPYARLPTYAPTRARIVLVHK